MIIAEIYRDKRDYIIGYKISGHAQSTACNQYDLICNSVSVMTQTPLLGMERYLKLKPEYKVQREDGILDVSIGEQANDSTQAILETMVCGLQDLARQYPKYICIKAFRR